MKTETHVARNVNRLYYRATNKPGDLTLVNSGPRLNVSAGRLSELRTLFQKLLFVDRVIQSPRELSDSLPLEAVFQRLSRNDRQPRERFENQFARGVATESLRRVFEQVRRVEEATAAPVTMTPQRAPQFINSTVSSPNAFDGNVEPFRRRSEVAWEHFNPPAPPPVNIEMITDNVMRALDRRVVAARERMGKI